MATKETTTRGASRLAPMIDHTLLRADATTDEIQTLCEEAKEYGFFSVCVQPSFVVLAQQVLMTSEVKVCTVIGFPLGANETQVKAFEAQVAIDDGADELDMVINLGALKSQKTDLIQADIAAVVEAAKGAPVKVILETGLLSEQEIVGACRIAKEAGAQFVKTSTGFSSEGATVESVSLMRKTVGPDFGVKASGGIRDYDTAIQMVEAGANRIGASASIEIVKHELSQATEDS